VRYDVLFQHAGHFADWNAQGRRPVVTIGDDVAPLGLFPGFFVMVMGSLGISP
jgi:hypothetical protein